MSNKLIVAHERNLAQHYKQLESVLPNLPVPIKPQRIARCILNAMEVNPYLANCTAQSVMNSAMTSAVLGLEVDNVMGQGYIVPFRQRGVQKAQFIPGYKGYITLADRAGYILEGQEVREGDEFDYQEGSKPFVHHKPLKAAKKERGDIQYVYAIARSNHLPEKIHVMHINDILEIRNNSAGYKSYVKDGRDTPWVSNFEAMAIKTPIRALGSVMPLNFQIASTIEGAFEGGHNAYANERSQVVVSGANEPRQKKTQEQPELVDEAGNPVKKMEDICGLCGGTGILENAGMSGPCPCQKEEG